MLQLPDPDPVHVQSPVLTTEGRVPNIPHLPPSPQTPEDWFPWYEQVLLERFKILSEGSIPGPAADALWDREAARSASPGPT